MENLQKIGDGESAPGLRPNGLAGVRGLAAFGSTALDAAFFHLYGITRDDATGRFDFVLANPPFNVNAVNKQYIESNESTNPTSP